MRKACMDLDSEGREKWNLDSWEHQKPHIGGTDGVQNNSPECANTREAGLLKEWTGRTLISCDCSPYLPTMHWEMLVLIQPCLIISVTSVLGERRIWYAYCKHWGVCVRVCIPWRALGEGSILCLCLQHAPELWNAWERGMSIRGGG